jgi:hypothetical protein
MTEYEDADVRDLIESLLGVLDGLEALEEARKRALDDVGRVLSTYGWKPPEEVKHESDS